MKCRYIVSMIIVLVLLMMGLVACGNANTSLVPGENLEEAANVATEPSVSVVGEWYSYRESDALILVLNPDMSFSMVLVEDTDSSLTTLSSGVFSLSDDKVILNYESGIQYECEYDSSNDCIYAYDSTFMCASKNSYQEPSVVGTWSLVYSASYFPYHFGELSHSTAESITYYTDNTYSINYTNSYEYGEYRVIHDGKAIEMDDAEYHPAEVMRFQLIGSNILLIEADPSFDAGIYYVFAREKQ